MRTFLTFCSLLFITLFSVSCGEEDYQKAIDRCDKLMVTLCSKSVSCKQNTYDDCETVFRQNMNCGEAKDTTKQYDRCISDIKNSSCSTFNALPSSCNEVIIVD